MYSEHRWSQNWLIKKALNDRVRERLPIFKGGIVIDLGCGVRPFEHNILDYATGYIGLDWSNTLHALHADIVADLNSSLPISENSFDHVVSFEVLEHLREPTTMLNEAFRILKPGGSITISTPFMWWVHEAPWDYFRYTKFGLEHLFKAAGFTSIEVKATTGFWSMWLVKLNYQLARLIRGRHFARTIVRAVLIPIWWTTQIIGLSLDRIFPDENETAGYFVTARKP